jgi:hypothetical protein
MKVLLMHPTGDFKPDRDSCRKAKTWSRISA